MNCCVCHQNLFNGAESEEPPAKAARVDDPPNGTENAVRNEAKVQVGPCGHMYHHKCIENLIKIKEGDTNTPPQTFWTFGFHNEQTESKIRCLICNKEFSRSQLYPVYNASSEVEARAQGTNNQNHLTGQGAQPEVLEKLMKESLEFQEKFQALQEKIQSLEQKMEALEEEVNCKDALLMELEAMLDMFNKENEELRAKLNEEQEENDSGSGEEAEEDEEEYNFDEENPDSDGEDEEEEYDSDNEDKSYEEALQGLDSDWNDLAEDMQIEQEGEGEDDSDSSNSEA